MASSNSAIIELPIGATFNLITDPRRYPDWLVGAQEIRLVTDDWPRVGSSFEHRIGVGRVRLPGSTTVRECDEPTHFALAAGMGPLGEARVDFLLREVSSDATEVTIEEKPSRGLARVGWLVSRPIIFGLLWGRNQVSLQMLAELGAASTAAAGSTEPPR